jgi:hypothetical protein
MDQSLFLSVARTIAKRSTGMLTLLTTIPPKLCATKIIGRVLACSNPLLVASCVSHTFHAFDNCLSKHRSDTRDLARSYRYWQLTRELLWVFAS